MGVDVEQEAWADALSALPGRKRECPVAKARGQPSAVLSAAFGHCLQAGQPSILHYCIPSQPAASILNLLMAPDMHLALPISKFVTPLAPLGLIHSSELPCHHQHTSELMLVHTGPPTPTFHIPNTV